jgi:N-acetylmuramoyl-L-alanine amidase
MARQKREPNRVLLLILAALVAANSMIIVSRLGRGEPLPGTDVKLPEYVTVDYIGKNSHSRPGTPLTEINAVVIHYVGNPGSSARANRNYFNNLALTKETYASSHFVVGLEGEIVACVPLTEIAYASNERNADTVSVEVCHPDESGVYAPKTYERVVELTAWLCRTFSLNPAEDVIRHYDVTGKICPKFYVEHPEAWEDLKADIAAKMEEQP